MFYEKPSPQTRLNPEETLAAYAAAGAATALAGSNSLEAAIHYSGCLHESIGNFERFPLNPPVSFYLFHFGPGVCEFTINLAALPFRSVVAYNVASTSFYRPYLSKLRWGQNISTAGSIRRLPGSPYYGILELGGQGQWTDRGRGFIGFRWNNGAGFQYGWARITKTRLPEDKIRLEDYAYADPGEPIRAGQKSSNEMVPDEGSLGGLALGAAGLLAWRKSRSQAAR